MSERDEIAEIMATAAYAHRSKVYSFEFSWEEAGKMRKLLYRQEQEAVREALDSAGYVITRRSDEEQAPYGMMPVFKASDR